MMNWSPEPFYVWWQRVVEPPPKPTPEPQPPPRVPTSAKALHGLDQMRSIFSQAGRQHYQQRRQR